MFPLLGAAVAFAVVVLMLAGEGEDVARGLEPSPRGVVGPITAPRRPVVRKVDVPPAAAGGAIIDVLDTDRQPLRGAVAYASPPHAREVAVHRDAVLGRSDATGRIEIEAEALTRGGQLVVWERRHGTCALPPVKSGERYEVVLSPSPPVTLRFHAPDRRPLAGVECRLSPLVLGEDDDASGPRFPGTDRRHAVTRAVSGGHGVAVVHGVRPGEHHLRVHLDGHVPLGMVDHERLWAPSDEHRIVMAPVWMAALRIEGDTVLNHARSGSMGEFHGDSAAMQHAQALGAAAAGGEANLVVETSLSPPETSVAIRVCLARGGWRTVHVPWAPWSADLEPTILAVDPDAAVTSGAVEVAVVDARGRACPGVPLTLVADVEGRASAEHVFPVVDGRARVPTGTYHVHVRDGYACLFDDVATVEVSPGATEQVTLAASLPLERCRLTAGVRDLADGVPARVRLDAEGGLRLARRIETGVPWSVWLPPGDVRVELRGFGLEPFIDNVGVERSDGDRTQSLAVVAEARRR